MTRWAPVPYHKEGRRQHIPQTVIECALRQAHVLQKAGLPAVLSLGHLAFHTDVPYTFLREMVTRQGTAYRNFTIRKHSGGMRYISVPVYNLLRTQRWIDRFILSKLRVSPYSYAFARGQSIVNCAEQHLGCTWLVKIDLRHFFESLSEIQVYHVFLNSGYSHLIAFEMARLCTKTTCYRSRKYQRNRWKSQGRMLIEEYNHPHIGHLPQGAPTSPKLANIIVYDLDIEIARIAEEFGLTFTRYADDMALSTASKRFTRAKGLEVIQTIYSVLPKYGLRPNPQKAQIIPPGARKIVLGLLVDSSKVRLPKKFRKRLECHLHFAVKDPTGHALRRGFHSVLGLKNHIRGLLAYAKQVDPEYVCRLIEREGIPSWPI